MLFIHLIHKQLDDQELSDYLLDSILDGFCNATLAISSDREYFEKTKNRLRDRDGLNFSYHGLNPLSRSDCCFLAAFVALATGKDEIIFYHIEDGDYLSEELKFRDDTNYDSTKAMFSLFADLRNESSGKNFVKIDTLLNGVKNLCSCIGSKTLSAMLVAIVSIYRNAINGEQLFIYGNESRNHVQLIKSSQCAELNGYTIKDLKTYYSRLEKVAIEHGLKDLHDAANKRIEYFEFRDLFAQEIKIGQNDDRFIKMLMWQASYFLILSRSYKDNDNFSTGIIYLNRALENVLQAALFFYGSASYHRGEFEVANMRPKGAGELWGYLENKHLTASESNKYSNVKSVFSIRNISSGGHGYSHLNKDIYDHCYHEVINVIKFLDNKIYPGKDFWKGITELANANLLKSLCEHTINQFLTKSMTN